MKPCTYCYYMLHFMFLPVYLITQGHRGEKAYIPLDSAFRKLYNAVVCIREKVATIRRVLSSI